MTTLTTVILAVLIPQLSLGVVVVIPRPDLTVTAGSGQYGVAGVAGVFTFSEEVEPGAHTVFYWGQREKWVPISFGALTSMAGLIAGCMAYFLGWGLCRWMRRLPSTPSSSVLPRLCIMSLLVVALVAAASLPIASGLADRETRAFFFGLPIGIGYWFSQLGLQSPIVLLPLSYFAALVAYILLPSVAIRFNRWSATAIALSVFICTATMNTVGWNVLFTSPN